MELGEEIEFFLKGNGLDCRKGGAEGQDFISVICPSGAEKTILPIGINASTIEEAERQQKEISDLLSGNTIIVTEDRWRRHPEMMRNRLLAHMEIFHSIYARNCEIRRIEKAEAAAFLKANHSYGDASCRYRYGMYLKRYTGHTQQPAQRNSGISASLPVPGTLVAVAEFSNARRWQKGDKEIRSYEWTRYASLAGIRICGGMGRMLRHFINEVQPDDIMSYADLEWSDGTVYRQLGFLPEAGKTPVTFAINQETWERTPMLNSRATKKRMEEYPYPPSVILPLYFQNFGSLKYRLKLTEW